jgi:hypothetical protein
MKINSFVFGWEEAICFRLSSVNEEIVSQLEEIKD